MTISSKVSALALVAVLAGSALAGPALAGDSAGFDASIYLAQLRYDGINAVDVDDAANGVFRATVRLADGHEVFRYFDKSTFQPINLSK